MAIKKFTGYGFVDMGMFPGWVTVSAGIRRDDLLKKMKKEKIDNNWILAFESKEKDWLDKQTWCAFIQEFEGRKGERNKKYPFIYLGEPFDFSSDSYCLLAHEVLHICQFYLPDLLDRNREYEAEAYLHTHIMSKCISVFKGAKEPKNYFNH